MTAGTSSQIKNIIPAIASTNAIVAAACANEAFKIVTNCAAYLDNNLMYGRDHVRLMISARSTCDGGHFPHRYMGGQGLYAPTFRYERSPHCVVCGEGVVLRAEPSTSLTQLMEQMEV
jgi:ubiquitin-activating enzyme E1 C